MPYQQRGRSQDRRVEYRQSRVREEEGYSDITDENDYGRGRGNTRPARPPLKVITKPSMQSQKSSPTTRRPNQPMSQNQMDSMVRQRTTRLPRPEPRQKQYGIDRGNWTEDNDRSNRVRSPSMLYHGSNYKSSYARPKQSRVESYNDDDDGVSSIGFSPGDGGSPIYVDHLRQSRRQDWGQQGRERTRSHHAGSGDGDELEQLHHGRGNRDIEELDFIGGVRNAIQSPRYNDLNHIDNMVGDPSATPMLVQRPQAAPASQRQQQQLSVDLKKVPTKMESLPIQRNKTAGENVNAAAEWSRLLSWLVEIKMEKYASNFRQGGITQLSVVELLHEMDLGLLGIDQLDRKTILDSISVFSARTRSLAKMAMTVDSNRSSPSSPRRKRTQSNASASESGMVSPSKAETAYAVTNAENIKSQSSDLLILQLLDSFDKGNYEEYQCCWAEAIDRLPRNFCSRTTKSHQETTSGSKSPVAISGYMALQSLHFNIELHWAVLPLRQGFRVSAEESKSAMNRFRLILDAMTDAERPHSARRAKDSSPGDKPLATFTATREFALYSGIVFSPDPLTNPLYALLFDPSRPIALRNKCELFFQLAGLAHDNTDTTPLCTPINNSLESLIPVKTADTASSRHDSLGQRGAQVAQSQRHGKFKTMKDNNDDDGSSTDKLPLESVNVSDGAIGIAEAVELDQPPFQQLPANDAKHLYVNPNGANAVTHEHSARDEPVEKPGVVRKPPSVKLSLKDVIKKPAAFVSTENGHEATATTVPSAPEHGLVLTLSPRLKAPLPKLPPPVVANPNQSTVTGLSSSQNIHSADPRSGLEEFTKQLGSAPRPTSPKAETQPQGALTPGLKLLKRKQATGTSNAGIGSPSVPTPTQEPLKVNRRTAGHQESSPEKSNKSTTHERKPAFPSPPKPFVLTPAAMNPLYSQSEHSPTPNTAVSIVSPRALLGVEKRRLAQSQSKQGRSATTSAAHPPNSPAGVLLGENTDDRDSEVSQDLAVSIGRGDAALQNGNQSSEQGNPDAAGDEWMYCDNNGQPTGPFTSDVVIERLLFESTITKSTHVWKKGMKAWEQLRNVSRMVFCRFDLNCHA
jgi:hypothetical protein